MADSSHPTGRILAIGVTKGSNASGLPWRVPFFRPRKGPIVAVEEIRSLRTGTVVDRVVDVGREWAGLERTPQLP